MTRRRFARLATIVGVLSCVTMPLGCKTHEHPSAFVGGYTFSRDYAGERRVLRIEPSAEHAAACMLAQLPTPEGAPWKQTTLAPGLHRSLISLLFDESRLPYYEADTKTSAAAEDRICEQLLHGEEFCYIPQVSVTGTGHVWRFGLQPDLTLSDVSRELIDEFLFAHDACWNSVRK